MGAGAVVTQDVPPRTVAAGTPAQEGTLEEPTLNSLMTGECNESVVLPTSTADCTHGCGYQFPEPNGPLPT